MKKFTVRLNDPADLGAVVMEDGHAVASCRPFQLFFKGENGGVESRQISKEDAIANAHLFSAAPELLEIVEVLSQDKDWQHTEEMRLMIEHALLKAYGKVPAQL